MKFIRCVCMNVSVLLPFSEKMSTLIQYSIYLFQSELKIIYYFIPQKIINVFDINQD